MNLLQSSLPAYKKLTILWPSHSTSVEAGVCMVNGKLEALIGIILWDIGAKVGCSMGMLA